MEEGTAAVAEGAGAVVAPQVDDSKADAASDISASPSVKVQVPAGLAKPNIFKGLGHVLLNAIKENDFTRALGMIMGGVELECVDSRGQSALHAACFKGSCGVVRLLLDNSANKDVRDHVYRVTPLHVASSRGLNIIVAQLIEAAADVNPVGIEGDTPLSRAAGRGYLDIVKKLLKAGAKLDPETPVLKDEELSLTQKSWRSLPTSPQSKRTRGRSPGRADSPTSPKSRCTTRSRGRSGSPQRQMAVREQLPAVAPLLKGAKRNAKITIIKLLVKEKANLHSRDTRGNCPLHVAAFHGNPNMVRALLQKNIDVEMENLQERSGLHYAARSGDMRCIKMLVEFKANVNHEDKDQITPLMCCGDPCGRKFLEDMGAKTSEHFAQISPPLSPVRSVSGSPERSQSPTPHNERSKSPHHSRRRLRGN